MRIGVYGGSFDPPHVAHVLLAAYALAVGEFDQILVVPVFAHAFNKELLPFDERVKLCELAFSDLANVHVSRIEAKLPVPSRTLTTLEAIASESPGAELRLLIGTDILADVGKWHAFEQVTRLAPLFVVGREGHAADAAKRVALPPISSTHARELCARLPQDEARRELAEILPSRVLDYILQRGLYRPA